MRNTKALRKERHLLYDKSHSDESKEKIRDARKKQKISHSQETKMKMSIAGRGRKYGKEFGDKISATKKAKYASGELVTWNKGLTKFDTPSLNSRTKKKFSDENRGKILSLYNNGFSINYLSDLLNVDWGAIKCFLNDNGIKTRNISEQKRIQEWNRK